MYEEPNRETTEAPQTQEPFVPSPAWKRAVAWVMFAIVILGVITWLLNIACPQWIDVVKGWFV